MVEFRNLDYLKNVSVQIFVVLIFVIFFSQISIIQLTSFNVEIVAFIATIMLAFAMFTLREEDKSRILSYWIFSIASIIVIISNFFFLDILSPYNPVLYGLILSQIAVFPFYLGVDHIRRKKIEFNSIMTKFVLFTSMFLLLIVSFLLRIRDAAILSPGRDSFHHYIGAKMILDSGATTYQTLPYVNQLLAFIFNNFGESLLYARLPFIIAGTLSVILIYILAKRISKPVGFISAVLLGLCPWAIGLSKYVRDYTFNVVYELIFITIIMSFPKKIRTLKDYFVFGAINGFLYIFLIVFARFERGLTISIIMGMFVASLIKLIFDSDIMEQIKSFDVDQARKYFGIAFVGFVTVACVAVFILVLFEFHRRMNLTFQPKWFFMFLSESPHPLLWYSSMMIPWFFILGLTLIPLIGKHKDKMVWLSFFGFYVYLIFFVFIAKPNTHFLYARYIYPALPFLIILFATSIYFMFEMALKSSGKFLVKSGLFLISLVLVLSIFSINNSILASDGLAAKDQGVQVISIEYRDYSELVDFLRNEEFSKDDIVIISELRAKDAIGWYFDFDYTQGRSVLTPNRLRYDIADNMYIFDGNEIDVIKENDEGWMIKRTGEKLSQDVSMRTQDRIAPTEELQVLGVEFEYLGRYSEQLEVYKWHRK